MAARETDRKADGQVNQEEINLSLVNTKWARQTPHNMYKYVLDKVYQDSVSMTFMMRSQRWVCNCSALLDVLSVGTRC